MPAENDVTNAELRVLEALWDNPRATVRAISETLYPKGGTSKGATVLKLLERLEQKGYVARDRNGPAQAFDAAVDRDAFVVEETSPAPPMPIPSTAATRSPAGGLESFFARGMA